MSEPTPFQKNLVAMTTDVQGLQATLEQFVKVTHQVQDVLLFHGHPEVVALDDDLDTTYRGQL